MGLGQCHQAKVRRRECWLVRMPNFFISRFEKRIYIPLPGAEARKRMFELHVGNTPCELTQKDYRELADQTEGYASPDNSTSPIPHVLQVLRFRYRDYRSRCPHATSSQSYVCDPLQTSPFRRWKHEVDAVFPRRPLCH